MSDLSIETPINRCSRIKRNGERCKRPPIRGGTVCASHGGRAPAVRAKAQMRLLMSADKLMAGLLKIALNDKIPVQHRLAAIRDGLDRAGLNARQNVDVDVAVGIKKSAAERYADVVESVLISVDDYDPLSDPDPNVIDAEVVDDEHERALDARIEATERERDKRRRRGLDPELPPGVESRLRPKRSPVQHGTPTPPAHSIEDDPRTRQPVATRDEDTTRGREQFLVERLELRPTKKRRRRV